MLLIIKGLMTIAALFIGRFVEEKIIGLGNTLLFNR